MHESIGRASWFFEAEKDLKAHERWCLMEMLSLLVEMLMTMLSVVARRTILNTDVSLEMKLEDLQSIYRKLQHHAQDMESLLNSLDPKILPMSTLICLSGV